MLSPPRLVGVFGALVSSLALWAQVTLGILPRSVLCAAGGGVAVRWKAGSRGDQTAGKDQFTMRHARTTQMRMHEARLRVPHVTSRQDNIYNVPHVSTVHRSPTINPHYPLMFFPRRPT